MFRLMPTSNIPSLVVKRDFHIEDHVVVNVLVTNWHLDHYHSSPLALFAFRPDRFHPAATIASQTCPFVLQ
jgi:hypothetical protein